MPALNIYVEDETIDRLHVASEDLQRTITQLAEAAVEEAALADAKARFANGQRDSRLGIGE